MSSQLAIFVNPILFQLCAKGYEHELGYLKALYSSGNSYNGKAVEKRNENMHKSQLPAEKDDPDNVCYRMLCKIQLYFYAVRHKGYARQLKALYAKGYADDRETPEHADYQPERAEKNSSEYCP